MTDEEDICTVSEFNRYYSNLVAGVSGCFYVRGEISKYNAYPSAAYFTIKDNESSLEVVMFSNHLRSIGFEPKVGDDVLLRGRGDIYQKSGKFSLRADMMRKYGIGEILERLRQLKEKWRSTYFAKAKKRIPLLVRNIFVVTSAQGAVIRDIIKTRNIRNAGVSVHILPAVVQGSECERTVSEMISLANIVVGDCENNGGSAHGLHDVRFDNSVLIVARGGGSFEDLLPFSSELIVRSMYESRLPVISSIGHETDEPLCDFVADRRASTPTQAVELCLGEISEIRSKLDAGVKHMLNSMKQMMFGQENRYESKKARFDAVLSGFCERQSNRLKECALKLKHAIADVASYHNMRLANLQRDLDLLAGRFAAAQSNRIDRLDDKLELSMAAVVENCNKHFESLVRQLELVSPFGVLDRGYSIISGQDGKIVSCPQDISGDGRYRITFKNEKSVSARISEVSDAG